MSKYDEMLASLNAESLKEQAVQWIRDWFEENGRGCNAIVGISGGKDSSVVAALCVEALGKDRVIGVLMPDYTQDDIEYAYMIVETLGIKYTICNIGDAINELEWCVEHNNEHSANELDIILTDQATINLPARVRMATLYAVSQSRNGRVANTCNLSEDWIGYSTRYGDSVGDFSPLSNLTTDEVIEIGLACGLPDALVYKVPSDGLCGKTDEDNFGFTYRQLNEYIRTGVCEDEKIKRIIDKKHKRNLFKLMPMPAFMP